MRDWDRNSPTERQSAKVVDCATDMLLGVMAAHDTGMILARGSTPDGAPVTMVIAANGSALKLAEAAQSIEDAAAAENSHE